MPKRAAVVCGVNRTGGLAPLESATSSASGIADWLKDEGFDVELVTDEAGPAHARDVKEALERFVTKPPTYEMLVVYFSGHGYWHARSDRWLFSDAPTDSSDAINLDGAMDVARNSGIATVVFISDACRSIPPTVEGQRVEGIDALPNIIVEPPSKVDYFKATSMSASAYEASIPPEAGGTGARESVLTKAFRLAYADATPDMVIETQVDGAAVSVVPNRRLETYLQPKVDELLASVDPTLQQDLEVNVPSADHVYIGKAEPPPRRTRSRRRTPPPSPPARPRNPGDDAAAAVLESLSSQTAPPPLGSVESEAAVQRLIPQYDVRPAFESECGFVISGARLETVATTPGRHGASAEILESGDGAGQSAILRMWEVEPAVSVVGELGDGRSFVLPALAGYIGHVTVDSAGVANVSYVPSAGSERHDMYLERQDEVDRLRALVALSTATGQFRVNEDNASALAEQVRVLKAADPTLGLYAAYGYSAAGLDRKITSVLQYMDADIHASLFDVALLARRIGTERGTIAPFCPMLTQGWNLLRPRGVQLQEPLKELRPDLQSSLWTTFGPEASRRLLDAVEKGDLQ